MLRRFRPCLWTFAGVVSIFALFLGSGVLEPVWAEAEAGPPGDARALLIGVDRCEALGELDVCCADARAMAYVLRRAGYRHTRTLVDADDPRRPPTCSNVEPAVSQIARKAGPEDTILIFFSGHGIIEDGEAYLVTTDENRRNAIALSWVKSQLNSSKAAVKVLILDVRHAGAPEDIEGIPPDLAGTPGLIVLLSCTVGQVSWPEVAREHSVFAGYMVEGLNGEAAGDDGRITAAELYEYVRLRTRAFAFEHSKPMQTPAMVGLDGADRPIAWPPADGVHFLRSSGPRIPIGWTSEDRRVKVATPQGNEWAEITYYTNTIGMDFVGIPAGDFVMGSTLSPAEVKQRWPGGKKETYEDEHPRHHVRIARPFYLGAHEVTRAQFARFVRETQHITEAEQRGKAFSLKDGEWGWHEGVSWRDPGFPQDDSHPVVYVSHRDARRFCVWLSEKDGRSYRPPTEAEWEYAARAGTDTVWFWGNRESGAQGRANVAGEGEEINWSYAFGNVRDGYTYTAPVGSFQPNGFGLYDMIGNVWEWCGDRYREGYYGHSPVENPDGRIPGSMPRYCVLRGGSWLTYPWVCRSATRSRDDEDSTGDPYSGFRVVCRPRSIH